MFCIEICTQIKWMKCDDIEMYLLVKDTNVYGNRRKWDLKWNIEKKIGWIYKKLDLQLRFNKNLNVCICN